MIEIKVKAKTDNAFNGLKGHYEECNTFKNKLLLKAHGVKQKLLTKEKTLVMSWGNLIKKIEKKIKTDFKEFVESVDEKVDEMGTDITNIRIGNEGIKGDIKLILDRQDRDNPVQPSNTMVQPTIPPPMTNTVTPPDTIPDTIQ